jgi:hypothetical protein
MKYPRSIQRVCGVIKKNGKDELANKEANVKSRRIWGWVFAIIVVLFIVKDLFWLSYGIIGYF